MRILTTLILIASPFVANACPDLAERPARYGEIYEELRTVNNETIARELGHELWAFWRIAPDAHAQELLDLGISRREQFDFEGAVEALDALTTYCPDFAEGYNQRAFVSFIRGDYAAALEDLERTVELAPDHIAAIAGQGLTLRQMGREEAAQTVLRQALELNPWLPERRYVTEPLGDDI